VIVTGAKFWFGVAGLGLVAIAAYLIGTDNEPFGLLVLLALVVAATILGTLHVTVGDGNVPAAAAEAEAAAATTAARSQLPAPWPALGALGAGVTAIGAAGSNALFYVGLGILAVTLFEWMVQGWAERATGDRAYNAALRSRLMSPIEVPVIALLVAGVVLLAFSRVLLALPKTGSTVIALVVAAAILGLATLVATRPRIGSSLVSAVVVVGAVALLGGGIVGAVAGEREFEEHGDESHATEEAGEGELEVTHDGEGFSPSTLEIPEGETVVIVFHNEDRENVEHGLQIQGVEGQPTTGAVGSGESAEVEVTAEAGTYTFIDSERPESTEPGELVVGGDTASREDPEVSDQEGGSNPDEETENPDGGESDPDDTTEVSTP
jgi:plastocyanin